MVNGVGFRIQEQVTTGRRRPPPARAVVRREITDQDIEQFRSQARTERGRRAVRLFEDKIADLKRKKKGASPGLKVRLDEQILSLNQEKGTASTGRFAPRDILRFALTRGVAPIERQESRARLRKRISTQISKVEGISSKEARQLVSKARTGQITLESAQELKPATRKALGIRITRAQGLQPGAIGTGIDPGTFFFPQATAPGGAILGRSVASGLGGGIIIQPVSSISIRDFTPLPDTRVSSDRGLTTFGFPSISLSDIETVGEFRAGQRQTFFERESARTLQTPLIDSQFELGAREFGRQRFGELSRREQTRLRAGSVVIGGAKLGTSLIQFGIPGFGGVIQADEFTTSFRERPISTSLFGPEVEAFRPIRDRPGDIIQTGIQVAPLLVGAPFAVRTFVREGRGGFGTLARGLSPIKTPSFEQFSLRGLAAQPTRTFGLETGVDPITGGRQFQFVSGREFGPLFGRGGATQVQTFEALQIPRGGRPPRTIIREGQSITEFTDPISGRRTGRVEFFTGGIDISRVGLPVRQRGQVVPGIEGFVGRGRIFSPGASQFQEFPVGGVGRRVGRRFFGVDIEPIGAGVRRPRVTELTLTQRGFRQRDLIRTDIDPTLFVRGRPIGRTDVLFRGGDLGIPRDEQGFQVLVSRGRRGRRGPRADVFQTDVGIPGITTVTRRATTTLGLPKSSSALVGPAGPGAFDVLRLRTSAFVGTGLFERTDLVGPPIGRASASQQLLIGPGLREQFKFAPIGGLSIRETVTTRRPSSRFRGISTFGQPQVLTQSQFQAPRLDQPDAFFQPTETILQPLTTPRTTGPPSIGFFPGPRGFGGGFVPIGFVPTLGGRGARRQRRRGRRARPAPLLPSFTAIVADVRGTFPEEISIGGVDLGITPGRIRRLPKRKAKRVTKKKKARKKK